MAKESGWLIEKNNSSPPVWFGVENDNWTWTSDHRFAIRFARHEDAVNVLKAFSWFTCHATFHIWSD